MSPFGHPGWKGIPFRLFGEDGPEPTSGNWKPPGSGGECTSCGEHYDESDPEAVTQHTESVDCGQSCRCSGKRRCYPCGGSFCMCAAH
jgi:hypothetical protein